MTTPAPTTSECATALLTILHEDARLSRAHGFARWIESLFPRRGTKRAAELVRALSGAPADVASATDYPVRALAVALSDNLDTSPGTGSDGTALGYLKGWVERGAGKPSGTFVLSSPTGLGKSVAGVWACLEHRGVFVRCSKLGELGWSDEARALFTKLARVPFLVLDELGREADFGPTPGRVAELIAERHDAGLPTLILTNVVARGGPRGSSFADRYGPHLLDRIEHDGGCWVPLRGKSRRGGTRPVLDDRQRWCDLAALAKRVEGACNRAYPKADADIDALACALGVSNAQIVAEVEHRRRWLARGMGQLAALGGPHAAAIHDAFGNGGEDA